MLKPRKRIPRREIKQDTLVTYAFKFTDFVNRHAKVVTTSAIGVAIVLIIGVICARSKRAAEQRASSALSRAIIAYNQEKYEDAIDILQSIINDCKGTLSAGVATFYLANAYFFTGDYDNARKYYSEYLDDYKDDEMLSSSSLAGIGACLEQKGRFKQAAEYYRRAADEYPEDFQAPQNYLNAGRCYLLAGAKDEAEKVLKKLIDKYPDSNSRKEAELYLVRLQQ